jgi:polyisoprenoid-binding protein YceI
MPRAQAPPAGAAVGYRPDLPDMSALPAAVRLLTCVAALLPLTARAAEHRYHYDTVHSQILFSVDHDGYSRPFGRLHIARGWLRFDPDDFSHAATELDIDLASLDMGDADWNAAVLKSAFLDASHARYAHFVSTSVERTDAHHGVLHGRLTLRGVNRELAIPFTFNREARTIFGLHTVAGFSATAMLDRTDFGMTSHLGSIGRQISLWLELEAIRDERTPARESTDAAQ